MSFSKALNKFSDDSISYALKDMSRTPEQREAKAKKQATKMSALDKLGRSFRKELKAEHKEMIQEFKDDNPKWAVTDAEYIELMAQLKAEMDQHNKRWGIKK